MGRIVGNNIMFFLVSGGFVITLVATFTVFQGDYGTGEKIACIIAEVILFFWSLFLLTRLFIDMTLPQAFQGRKISVGGPWSYDMLRVGQGFMRYLAGQGAIIVEDEADAEFRIIMDHDFMDPTALSFKVSDPRGQQTHFRAYPFEWPRSAAMPIATFIRNSDRGRLD